MTSATGREKRTRPSILRHPGDGALCSETSADALEACLHEAEGDLFIARGKCNNLWGAANRRRCRLRASRTVGNAREECRAQFPARERVCRALGQRPYDPVIDPAKFVTPAQAAPAAACTGDCLVTRDWTPIEPDAAEFKYYAPGVGMILEVDVETGDRVELVNLVTSP